MKKFGALSSNTKSLFAYYFHESLTNYLASLKTRKENRDFLQIRSYE